MRRRPGGVDGEPMVRAEGVIRNAVRSRVDGNEALGRILGHIGTGNMGLYYYERVYQIEEYLLARFMEQRMN